MARVWKISFDQRLKVATFGFGKEHSDASLRQMRHAQNGFFIQTTYKNICETNILRDSLRDSPKRLNVAASKMSGCVGQMMRGITREGKLEGRFLI